MVQIVEIDGVGEIEFPDGMSREEMTAAIHENFPETRPEPEPPSMLDRIGNFLGQKRDQEAGPRVSGDDARAIANYGRRGQAPQEAPQAQQQEPQTEDVSQDTPEERTLDVGAIADAGRRGHAPQQSTEPQEPKAPEPARERTLDVGAIADAGRRGTAPERETDQPQEERQFDTFAEATGKAVGNVPERFQQAYAGLTQMIGEDMQESRQQTFARNAERLGMSVEDYQLLAWAGQEGLIPEDAPANAETIAQVKDGMAQSLTDEQLAEVADMGLINPDDMVAHAERIRDRTQSTMERPNAEPGSVAYYTSAAIGSLAEMTPALIVGAITRNPQAAMSVIGGQVTGQQYAEGRDQGLEPTEARKYAVASAAAEAIPEYIPLSRLLKPGANIFRKAFEVSAANALQESLTEVLNIGIERDILDAEMTWGEARQRIQDAGIIGSIAGPGMVAINAPVSAAAEGVRNLAGGPQREAGRALEQEVEGSEFAESAESVAERSMRPSMVDLVREKLRERGVDFDFTPDFSQMLPNNERSMDVTPPMQIPDDAVRGDQAEAPAQPQQTPATQAEPQEAAVDPQQIRGEPIDDEWSAFSEASGTRGVPRSEMPQIKAENRGAMANFLSARGVESTEETVPASSLRPTQREFSEERVQAAKNREGGDRAILVASDGHIVDGHHQWMARLDQGEDVRVIRLDAPIDQVLEQVREMPSVEQESQESTESPNNEALLAELDEITETARQRRDEDVARQPDTAMNSAFDYMTDAERTRRYEILQQLPTFKEERADARRRIEQRIEERNRQRSGGPRSEGAESTAYTPDGREVGVRYRLVEADDLVTSHTIEGNVNPNFPDNLQPRDRSRQSARAQMMDIAQNPNPERLLESVDTDRGAPIISPDGVVESGNGRSIGITEAYRRGNAEPYRQAVTETAQRLGLSGADTMRNPVLVRERATEMDDEQRRQFAVDSNRGAGISQAASETAASDAQALTDDDLALLRVGDNGDVLASSNQPFLQRFGKIIGQNELAEYQMDDGQWNAAYRKRIEQAIFAKAYGNTELLAEIAENPNPDLRNLLSAMMQAAPTMARLRSVAPDQAADFAETIRSAVSAVARSRTERQNLQELLSQGDLLGGGMSQDAILLAELFDTNMRSARRLGTMLRDVASQMETSARSQEQNDIFTGEPAPQVTASQALETQRESNNAPEQNDIFDTPQDAGESNRQSQSDEGQRATAEVAEENQVTREGITVTVPRIDARLVDDYNRATHLGRGRDLNAELESIATNVIDKLSDGRNVLSTPEQKAAAPDLINDYLQKQADFMRWMANQAARSPSWLVTGRSGRKQTQSQERHMDEYRRRVERLEVQEQKIKDRLFRMRPDSVKEQESLNQNKKDLAFSVMAIADYMRDGATEAAKDARRWASPKANKMMEAMSEKNRGEAVKAVNALNRRLEDIGGLRTVLGPKSKAAKTATDLMTEQRAAMSDTSNATADVPMENWVPPYSETGIPPRPPSETLQIGDRTVKLLPEDKPTRRESIRVQVQGIIGERLYQGKIKGKRVLGFYRSSNSEVRNSQFDNVEVLAHEMAHFLDIHYEQNGRFTAAYNDPAYIDEVKALSYTNDPKLVKSEGFAEFVRLWLTNYDQAQARAPGFTGRFEEILAQDKKLNRKMTRLQTDMHRWYRQGSLAQAYAVTSGNQYSASEQVNILLGQRPGQLWRQHWIDKIHAAKVMTRTINGELQAVPEDAYKQLQMLNGIEGTFQEMVKHGAPFLDENGDIRFKGPSLHDVWSESLKAGPQVLREQELYFIARRARELKRQGRENLISDDMIREGLAMTQKHPHFKKAFSDYQEYRKNSMDFYVDSGYITADAAQAMMKKNKEYVPFHRVVEGVASAYVGGAGFQQLRGGQQNIKPVYDNMMMQEQRHLYAAFKARALRRLYSDALRSQDGSLFLSKIGPDSKKVQIALDQMSDKTASAMAELGVSIAENGSIAGDGETVVDKSQIQEYFENNPEELMFWTFGHKPDTRETQVDSFIDYQGKRQWIEIQKDNELLIDMLDSMDHVALPEGILGTATKVALQVKNFQTLTITSMAQFVGPNIVRDAQQAFMLSGGKFRPGLDTLRGFGAQLQALIDDKSAFHEMKAQGGPASGRVQTFFNDNWGLSSRASYTPRKPFYAPSQMLSSVLEVYMAIADSPEIATRLGYYLRMKPEVGAREAAWEAREISTDYRKHGSYGAWVLLQRTSPFLNAYTQSVDRDIRALAENKGEMKLSNLVKTESGRATLDDLKTRIWLAGALMMSTTALLALLNDDEERYEALTPDQKTRFYNVFVNGRHYTIPKPHGFISLMSQGAESAMDVMRGQAGSDAWETMAFALAYHFGADATPGIINPVAEVALNRTFTGAPIVSPYAKNREPQYQYDERTPLVYVNLGRKLNVSPAQAEHLMSGYTGYLSDYITEVSERLLWDEEAWGERPFQTNYAEMFATQFNPPEVAYRTKWTTGYYDLRQRAAAAQGSLNFLLSSESMRDSGPAEQFAADEANTALVGLNSAFNEIDSGFSDQQTIIAGITYNPELTAEEKESRIEDYYRQKNEVLSKFYRQAEEAIREIEENLP